MLMLPIQNLKSELPFLLTNGEFLGGSNQENASYPVCICAERVALSAAASLYPKHSCKSHRCYGQKLSTGNKTTHFSLRKLCRQFMSEVEDKHQQTFKVILQGQSGPIYIIDSAKGLLPLSFDARFL